MDRPSRARRRFHTDRIVANRRARFIRELGFETRLAYGRLADRDPWDCGRRCFLCHFEKLTGGGSRRARAERDWRRDWGV
ncbi:MAG: hypothetical protein QOJ29_4056 [Thermoleophilaceae bacterium]|nr:hypothetical protein [Thermoleophilaceae bacterium]